MTGRFGDAVLPGCDAFVASLALHHVRTATEKAGLYRALRARLPAGGLLISADCFPSEDERLAGLERRDWRRHLLASYSELETDDYFAAWAREDVYFPLPAELVMLTDAGFRTDVIWRSGAFGVIAARWRRSDN